jgi:hypothetical protein
VTNSSSAHGWTPLIPSGVKLGDARRGRTELIGISTEISKYVEVQHEVWSVDTLAIIDKVCSHVFVGEVGECLVGGGLVGALAGEQAGGAGGKWRVECDGGEVYAGEKRHSDE